MFAERSKVWRHRPRQGYLPRRAGRRAQPEFPEDEIDCLLRKTAIGGQLAADNGKKVFQLRRVVMNEGPARNTLLVIVCCESKRSHTRVSKEDGLASKSRFRNNTVRLREQIFDLRILDLNGVEVAIVTLISGPDQV